VNRLLLLIIISLVTGFIHPSFAQWDDAMVDNHSGKKYAIGAYGNADFSSNCITSAFAYNFLEGNYLDDNLKQQVSSRLMRMNRLGFSLSYGIYGVLYNDTIAKKKVYNFFFALRHKTYLNASFTPDDFNVPFFGNASYAGKTAQLSPFYLNSLSYQQLEIGIVRTNFGEGAQFGAGISFLAGQQYTALAVPSATFYTDTNGQYLTFSSNAQVFQSDTSSGYLTRLNGYGASLDLYFRAPYKIGKKPGTISVSVTDLGFIWWNKKSLTYQRDTSYTYSGIAINGLSDLQNASFNTFSADSLRNKYFPFQKEGFYSSIPTTLSINTNTALTEKFHLELGYWYIFNANDIGYSYVQADKYFSHGWMVALQAGYGGYGGINGSLSMIKQFKASKLVVNVAHLQGLILPAQFGGAGCYINYVQSF
jgi:hypothetical protein